MIRLKASFPVPKTWWAKQITDELYTAGRLTESQFKNALESGFRSVVSLYRYEDSTYIGTELVPSSERMRYLAGEVGLFYDTVLETGDKWMTKDQLEAISKNLDNAPRPTLLHCNDSFASTTGVLLYMAMAAGRGNEEYGEFGSKQVYSRLHSLGFTSVGSDLQHLIADITGDEPSTTSPSLELSVSDWHTKYWLVRPVYKNVYITGQIKENYLPNLKELGIKYICNLRPGAEWKGKPSQEEVTLQNVRCYTETYDEGGRQTEERLKATRVYPEVSSSYMGEDSEINYETTNPLEFGDDVGFSEEMMRAAIERYLPGVKYIHAPCDSNDPLTVENTWEPYKDMWMSVKPDENILFTCRTGFRAVVAALLMAGSLNNKSSGWALQRTSDLGYHVRGSARDYVIPLYQEFLGDYL